MKIVVFGKDSCPYTQAAINGLKSFGLNPQYISVPPNVHGEQIGEMSGTKSETVPVVIINGVWIGGYTELKEHMNNVWNKK